MIVLLKYFARNLKLLISLVLHRTDIGTRPISGREPIPNVHQA